MTERVAFIGLGVMGYPMAGHLAAAGNTVTVYNRTGSRAQRWVEQHGGRAAATPATAASDADVVFCCVGNDDDVRAVVAAPDGALAGMKPGTLLVDHTTASARLARELAALCRQQEAEFIDAPVSGGQSGAEQGTLSIMCGGEPAVFERVAGLLDCYAGYARLLGPAGAGQMAKMVNQVCIAGLVQGLAEGLHFAQRAGMDVAVVIDVISRGAAQSWQMTNRSATMAAGEFDFGFAIDWMRKDLAIALEEAQHNGAQLPVTQIVDGYYSELQRRGHGRWDTSALIALLNDQA
ncbi:MAG: NAD(P)-dependent oxidoreductase [Gammaproteobacteria bacterium]|nr:NAD(P)-dependent oxidoreductase [Gammaproteobacteria bacterium]NNF59912.1 NAD(P)-dependent oxidoreductase [Gammaproteobacteria bacterium]NNM21646.1 NAD(P)-dependent oxidoreductase [Gammaproteobacteria bacterium]